MRSLRVLVAEDNEDHRFLTVRALKAAPGADVDVDTVADGEELLDFVYARGAHVDRELPHVIFLDLRMPKRGGLEVLEQLKSDAALSSIPVVVLSSSDSPADIDGAYDRGSNAYVTKPRKFQRVGEDLRAITDYWVTRAELPGLAR